MSFIFTGTEVKDAVFNNTTLDSIYFNGTEVYTSDKSFNISYTLSFSTDGTPLATDTAYRHNGYSQSNTFSHVARGASSVSGVKSYMGDVHFYGGAGTSSRYFLNVTPTTTRVDSRDFNATIRYVFNFSRVSDDGYPDVRINNQTFDVNIYCRNGVVTASPNGSIVYQWGSGTSPNYYYDDGCAITSASVISYTLL